MLLMLRFLPLMVMGGIRGGIRAGHSHRHHNNNRLMELLTAGIVAKVLQKQEGDGGGGHEYYPVHIPLPVHHHGHHMHASGSHQHHHHVTEKIIPIPVPHHTTRIIHINADAHHSSSGQGGGGEYDQGGGNYGGSSEMGGHSGAQTKIKQIVFQDSGVYGMQAQPMQVQAQGLVPVRQQTYLAIRRPTVGMVPAVAAHPAYMTRPRYPMVAIRQRIPQMPAPYGAASMYPMPYRRVPAPPSPYMNPMMMRRPYPAPMTMQAMPGMPAMW